MTKVFVTGATGFIGNNLVSKLLSRGYQVKVLVRHPKKLELFNWKDSVEIVYGDLLEPETFHGKINDCEVVIHSAALIKFWNKIWEMVHAANVLGTRYILKEAMRAGCKRFIHISSVAAIGYGENGEPINESHTYNWDKYKICYMESKREAELEVLEAVKHGLNAIIVNPANVWGRGDYHGRRVPVIKAVKFGLPFYVGAGTNFVDVEAVCHAIINAIKLGKTGERYILGGDNITIKEFLSIIADELKVGKPFIKLPKLPIILYSYTQEALSMFTKQTPKPAVSQLCFLGKNMYYDSTKAIKELRMPQISFRECVHNTVDFYKGFNWL